MYKHLEYISTVGMTHEEWLKNRMESIGGSDAAAIVGLSVYSSPYSVWADKVGLTPPKEDNEAMRQGRDLEEYVAQRFTEETGKKVRRRNAIIRNPDFLFAHANVDRLIVGEDAGLECKTTSVLNLKKFANGEYPANYYVQCMHYMMVTGCRKWYLAVLILGKEFKVFEIDKNEEEIEALKKCEEEFFGYVMSRNEPPADGSKATADAISTIYRDSADGQKCDLTPLDTQIRILLNIKKAIKEKEDDLRACESAIKQYMGSAETGESAIAKVSWKTQTRRTFDSKKFIADCPGFDAGKYMRETSTRTFRVTEIESN